jgi:hypothetical protein
MSLVLFPSQMATKTEMNTGGLQCALAPRPSSLSASTQHFWKLITGLMVPLVQSQRPDSRASLKDDEAPFQATLFLLICKQLNCLGKANVPASISGVHCASTIHSGQGLPPATGASVMSAHECEMNDTLNLGGCAGKLLFCLELGNCFASEHFSLSRQEASPAQNIKISCFDLKRNLCL